jgi:TRAP-type C4-dicarboxylate transport system substrate-binding protein
VLTGHGCINIVKGQKEGAVRKTIAILGSAIFFAVAPGVCIVSLRAWEALDAELKAIVAHACAAEASFALAEMERLNAEALAALIERHNVTLRVFPRDVVDAARKVATDVLGEVAAQRAGTQGARQLRGVPRADGAVVQGVDQGGAGGEGGVGAIAPFTPAGV